jgi:hypothetical protein
MTDGPSHPCGLLWNSPSRQTLAVEPCGCLEGFTDFAALFLAANVLYCTTSWARDFVQEGQCPQVLFEIHTDTWDGGRRMNSSADQIGWRSLFLLTSVEIAHLLA